MKDLGELHYFLGVKVVQDASKGQVRIGQPSYTENVLKKFGMENSKPIETPIDPSLKLCKASDQCIEFDQNMYQSAVGKFIVFVFKNKA